MPAQQGALRWPARGASRTALVGLDCLPVGDACIDRVLLVHALERVGTEEIEQLNGKQLVATESIAAACVPVLGAVCAAIGIVISLVL